MKITDCDSVKCSESMEISFQLWMRAGKCKSAGRGHSLKGSTRRKENEFGSSFLFLLSRHTMFHFFFV